MAALPLSALWFFSQSPSFGFWAGVLTRTFRSQLQSDDFDLAKYDHIAFHVRVLDCHPRNCFPLLYITVGNVTAYYRYRGGTSNRSASVVATSRIQW
jgi:hypothetical protein